MPETQGSGNGYFAGMKFLEEVVCAWFLEGSPRFPSCQLSGLAILSPKWFIFFLFFKDDFYDLFC